MAIRKLFEKPIDRFIEGVIKADDERNLLDEMEEYIVTRDISRKLHPILENYCGHPEVNGVWISGFFGSGKSHLLKMLSLALEKKHVDGRDLSGIFLEKLRDTEDEFLVGDMERSLKVPSRSILFNIDQKADSTVQYTTNRILGVFLKVFNEMCGFCSSLPFFAEFERDMQAEGLLERLKQTYREQTGKIWETERHRFHTIRREEFTAAYAEVKGVDEERADRLLTEYRETFNLSIEDFAKKVRDFIGTQPEGFRLNFFVDEVGQFIADNTQRMLNLQTLAETLSTVCAGRAWIFVTSQASLEEVVGTDPGQDFSRIQDRFKVKVNLDGKDVSEVIQLRLLKKNSGAESGLKQIYESERENIRTLFTFGDGTQTYQRIRNSDHFVITYPVMPYQYDLFQQAMMGLSRHNTFTGRQTSVGERSMLGVFQDVLKEMADLQPGNLASFDKMFQGIRQALKPSYLNLVNFAENNLDRHPLALRLLRALALVKYVDSFKASADNLSILLIDQFGAPVADLQQRVRESLQLLEQETYIQRNGDFYSYLTDIEKDVENEIKGTEITESEQIKFLSELVFTEVIQTRQFRFEDNRQFYTFARKMDGALALGQDAELALNVAGPFHEHAGDETVIRNHSMGRPELLVILPEDRELQAELAMFLKTDRYSRTHGMGQVDDAVRGILREKDNANQKRRQQLRASVEELLREAKLVVGNREVDAGGDARSRLESAFQELVRSTYPHLKMLNGHEQYQEEDLRKYLLDDLGDLFGGQSAALSEAELEIRDHLRLRSNRGEKTSFKELLEQFERNPYGWPLNSVRCLLAQLFRKGRVDVRFEGSSLDERMLLQKLPQSAQAGLLVLRPLEEIDPLMLHRLKNFHHEFFKKANPCADFRGVIREFRNALEQMLHDFEQLRLQQSAYPFLASLGPALESLKELNNQGDSAFLDEIETIEEKYQGLAEDLLDPVQSFMKGPQFNVYSEVIEYWRRNRDDALQLGSPDTDAIQKLVDSTEPWNDTRQAKASLDSLRAELDARKDAARKEVSDLLEELKGQLRYQQKFSRLSAEEQEEILKPLGELKARLPEFESISSIVSQKQRAREEIFVKQLNRIAGIRAGDEEVNDGKLSVSSSEIEIDYPAQVLSSEEDLEQYLAALGKAYREVLRGDKKIALS